VGFKQQIKALQTIGVILVIIAVLVATGEYLLLVPWWLWLAMIGGGILWLAVSLLKKKR
jgi:hypothetical protein